MKYEDIDDETKDLLKELGNIGTGNAVTSLAQMMNSPFDIENTTLRLVNYREVLQALNVTEEIQTGIIVEIFGKLKGIFLFLMNRAFTETILNAFLGEGERDMTQLEDMEISVLNELGNIMCGSYIRALSQLLNLDIDVSVPDLCIDMGGAILSVPLSRFLKVSDNVLLIENEFRMGDNLFTCRLLFMPEMDSLDTLLQALGK